MKLFNISLTLEQKRNLKGYLFILPFLIGFALFVLDPIIRTLTFSMSELSFDPTGYHLDFIGLENYHYILMVHGSYVRDVVETVLRMASDVPAILVFSFFAAVLLNQDFKGRTVARIIFFLPVVLGAGIVLQMEQGDYMMELMQQSGMMERGWEEASGLVMELRLPDFLLEYVVLSAERISEIVSASGVQILIFLAGLQSVSPSLYEAADVEGATGWEKFWKITLPLLSPLILTNTVYTIIDFFTSPRNPMLGQIRQTAFHGAGFGVSTAMAWVYFLVIIILLFILLKTVSKWVFYRE